MTNILLKSVFCAALIASPAILTAGSLAPVVADQAVVAPQQPAAAPVVGSLDGRLVAGGVLLALVAVAASNGGSSTSGTN